MIVIAHEATPSFSARKPHAIEAPRFAPGDLVRHRRYGYRGVIVECDAYCKAGMDWYLKNQTQPSRRQPWYHVLVDKTGTTTYAAQENLESDPSAEPIDHPLIDMFFDDFDRGRYLRNERAWKGWE
jgi:heat shock protein HspQ